MHAREQGGQNPRFRGRLRYEVAPRFLDDVVDIAVTALISNLRVNPPIIRGPAGDNVDFNDVAYNKVFPYESTPQNGRNHSHP